MSDLASAPSAAPVASEPAKISAGQRLLRVFSSPGEVFDDIARKPTIALVLVALIVVSLVGGLCIVPKLDMSSVMDQMAASGVPEDKQAQAMHMVSLVKWFGLAATPVSVATGLALFTGLYFLVLKLLGADSLDFKTLFSGVAHAAWPVTAVRTVLVAIVSLTRTSIDPNDVGHLVKSNLGGFMPSGSPHALVALGDSVDLFAIWQVVLITLVLSRLGRISKGQAATVAIVFWFLGTVLKVGAAALQGLSRH